MTSTTQNISECRAEEGLAGLIEYLSITAILTVMVILIMFTVNAAFIEGPSETLQYHHFVDIGNGVSVRIVDLYLIAPNNGTISTKFDIPDDVANQEYTVKLDPLQTGAMQRILVTNERISSSIAIGGIGATRGVTGETSGAGLNRITYDSSGV